MRSTLLAQGRRTTPRWSTRLAVLGIGLFLAALSCRGTYPLRSMRSMLPCHRVLHGRGRRRVVWLGLAVREFQNFGEFSQPWRPCGFWLAFVAFYFTYDIPSRGTGVTVGGLWDMWPDDPRVARILYTESLSAYLSTKLACRWLAPTGFHRSPSCVVVSYSLPRTSDHSNAQWQPPSLVSARSVVTTSSVVVMPVARPSKVRRHRRLTGLVVVNI